jgi:hypothetical protein
MGAESHHCTGIAPLIGDEMLRVFSMQIIGKAAFNPGLYWTGGLILYTIVVWPWVVLL